MLLIFGQYKPLALSNFLYEPSGQEGDALRTRRRVEEKADLKCVLTRDQPLSQPHTYTHRKKGRRQIDRQTIKHKLALSSASL